MTNNGFIFSTLHHTGNTAAKNGSEKRTNHRRVGYNVVRGVNVLQSNARNNGRQRRETGTVLQAISISLLSKRVKEISCHAGW